MENTPNLDIEKLTPEKIADEFSKLSADLKKLDELLAEQTQNEKARALFGSSLISLRILKEFKLSLKKMTNSFVISKGYK